MIIKYGSLEEAAEDPQCAFIAQYVEACEYVTEEMEEEIRKSLVKGDTYASTKKDA